MPENSRGRAELAVLGTQALDQAVCGVVAGCVSVLCMHPLDLLKVKFQVDSTLPQSSAILPNSLRARSQIIRSLSDIVRADGWRGLYRGLSPNMVGNAASWGCYFLWYSIIKGRMADAMQESKQAAKLNAAQHLLGSASSGVITAMMTNPLWVVKTRMFTTRPGTPGAYRGVLDGLYRISIEEGPRGLWKGSILALIGVSNGAIQFMTYEELKKWRQGIIYRSAQSKPSSSSLMEHKIALSNIEYVVLSGLSKLLAIGITYPYQVVRSRLQVESLLPVFLDLEPALLMSPVYPVSVIESNFHSAISKNTATIRDTCGSLSFDSPLCIAYISSGGIEGILQRARD